MIRNQYKKGIPFKWTYKDWENCKNYFDFKCVYCNKKLCITQEHFIPISNILTICTVIENMLPTCVSCNSSKNNKLPDIWCTSEQIEKVDNYFKSFKDLNNDK